MNAGIIASRYAKALLKFVSETGAGEKVYSQVCVLADRMQNVHKLADVVQKHREVSLERKVELLEMAAGEPLAPELRNFLNVVEQHGRMEFLLRIWLSFAGQYRLRKNMKIGTVVTARPVEGLKDAVQKILSERTGAEVVMEEAVDPSIIGGFVLRVDDLKMDASVKRTFSILRKELIEDNNRIV